jgi:hypothetical protein
MERRMVSPRVCVLLTVLCLPFPAAARAGDTPLSLDGLARLGWPELEALYRAGTPTPLQDGYFRGRPVYCPEKALSGVRTKLTSAIWHGKIVEDGGCSLINQWHGFRAIRAKLSMGESLLDGKPSLIMDYSQTSHVWADVRDEVREVAPGLFVGAMYRRKGGCCRFEMFFVLEAPCGCLR